MFHFNLFVATGFSTFLLAVLTVIGLHFANYWSLTSTQPVCSPQKTNGVTTHQFGTQLANELQLCCLYQRCSQVVQQSHIRKKCFTLLQSGFVIILRPLANTLLPSALTCVLFNAVSYSRGPKATDKQEQIPNQAKVIVTDNMERLVCLGCYQILHLLSVSHIMFHFLR